LAFASLILFVLWGFLSTAWSLDAEATIHECITFVFDFTFAWMLWEFVDSEEGMCFIFRAFIFGCCVSIASMFLTYMQGSDIFTQTMDEQRLSGGGLNPNGFAGIMCLAIPMAMYMASKPTSRGYLSRWFRYFYWCFIPLAGLGTLMTGSRMGAFLLIVALAGCLWTSRHRGARTIFALIAGGGAGVLLVRRFVSEALMTRISEGTEAHTFQSRFEFWIGGLRYWVQHPIEGAGISAFPKVNILMTGEHFVAHNTYVSVLVETGIVGFGLMATVWTILVCQTLAMRTQEKLLWLTILVIWASGAFVGCWEYAKYTWLIYGLVLAHYAIQKKAGVLPHDLTQTRSRTIPH
jgi:O-antigen ligase